MEVSGQLHAPATLPPRKESPVPIGEVMDSVFHVLFLCKKIEDKWSELRPDYSFLGTVPSFVCLSGRPVIHYRHQPVWFRLDRHSWNLVWEAAVYGRYTNVAARITAEVGMPLYNVLWRIDPFAGQSPRNGRVQPLLCNRQINKHPFLSNGSVNTFSRKRCPVYR
jgi:hypothetical protein